MERKMNIGGTEPNEPATPTAMNEAVEETGTVPPRKAGPPLPRRRRCATSKDAPMHLDKE